MNNSLVPWDGAARPTRYAEASDEWGPASPEPAVAPVEYLRALSKRRRAFVVTFVLVLGAIMGASSWQPRVYRATAKVQVLESAVGSGGNRPTAEERSMALETELKVLRSSVLAEKAAALLAETDKISVDEIMARLIITTEDPDVLVIRVEHTDPERAARIANAVQDAYIAHNAEFSRAEMMGTRLYLEQQVQQAQAELNRANRAIVRFKARHGIRDTDLNEVRRAQDLLTATMEADRVRAELNSARAVLRGLQRRLAMTKPTIRTTQTRADPAVEGLNKLIADTEVEIASESTMYEDDHPRIVTLRRKLQELRRMADERARKLSELPPVQVEEPNPAYESLKEQIRQQETQVEMLRPQVAALEASAARLQVRTPETPAVLLELARLENVRDVADKSYTGALEGLRDADLKLAGKRGGARKIDVARPPRVPIRPRPLQTLAIALAVALMAAVSLVLVQEHTRSSVDGPDELSGAVGMPTLGFIPAARNTRDRMQITTTEHWSRVSEGFRMVHASLVFASRRTPFRTLMLTSATAREGKSFCATNLAVVYAQSGTRTLLIDADLRRPTQHHSFPVELTPGLSAVLAGDVSLADAIRPSGIPNLQVLPSGLPPLNPAGLLGSEAMAQLIETAREHADLVIFDTPPALAVADAAVLSAQVDATVLVVAQGRVPGRAIAEISRMVDAAGGRILGAVFNRVRPGSGSWYYSYSYSYRPSKQDQKLLTGSGGA
ncbi:MAG: polysaccharide biosynthesis tyrosine autokinase [Armatimonadetes bacterium]|jgi:succinoglycan biosynthesis transport protein ExoP|nr:polysaccharide biosynthesis tyrosine autokinase [Armatimonadota bacterium]